MEVTAGERVARAAAGTVGVRETGRNNGPTVRKWQEEAAAELGLSSGTYHGEPWCGMAVMHWYRVAKVAHGGLAHPAVSEICRVGERDGLRWSPSDGAIPPGSILVTACGVHVGIVASHDAGSVWASTIEGNTGDAVRSRRRFLGGRCRVYIPRAVAESWKAATHGPPRWIVIDPKATGRTYGPWRNLTREQIEAKRARWRVTKPWLARHSRVATRLDGRLVIEVGPRARYGPFRLDEPEARALARRLAKQVGHKVVLRKLPPPTASKG